MSLPNYMGCLMEFCKSVSLYYTKMCFKILKFFRRKSVFIPSCGKLSQKYVPRRWSHNFVTCMTTCHFFTKYVPALEHFTIWQNVNVRQKDKRYDKMSQNDTLTK
jgi:hypothetical protein